MTNADKQNAIRLKPLVRGITQWVARLRGHVPSRHTLNRCGWGALATVPGIALAGPTGEAVVAGGVVVDRPDAARTEITQSTQNAIVNWQRFSIDGDELVLIQQPNASSAILNRVIGSQQSRILGQLQANGQVFLVNPQGVYIAPGAKVDVGALAVSALDIKDDDFLAQNYVFAKTADGSVGVVENAGEITSADGGYVVLAGDYVNNSGVITAKLGTVVLGAGSEVTMDIDNGGLVGFAIDEQTVVGLAGVDNLGDIVADGGRVVMTAKVANDLVATAVNNEGLVRAQRIVEQGGEVFLHGGGAQVVQAGTIDVAAASGGGGGRAVIQGDEDVIVDSGSRTIATGDASGHGGEVRIIADGRLDFRPDAVVDVTAGEQGDSGGLVELSGGSSLAVRGEVAAGAGGTVIIDPAVLTVQNNNSAPYSSSSLSYGGSMCPTSACVGRGFVEGQLNANADVVLVADQTIQSSGAPFTINATSGAGDLAVKIMVTSSTQPLNCSMFGVCDNSDLAADPTGNINLSGVNVNILGSFMASAGTVSGNVNLGNVSATNININAGSSAGNINVGTLNAFGSTGGEGTPGPASIALAAPGGNITVPNLIASTPGSSASVTVFAGGTLNVGATTANGTSAAVSFSGSNVNINGLTNVSGTSAANLSVFAAGNVTVNGPGVNVIETGGGSATASFNGFGNGLFNAPITVSAGMWAQAFFISEGPTFRNLSINRPVTTAAPNNRIWAGAVDNLVTGGSGRLNTQQLNLVAWGPTPTIDVDSTTQNVTFFQVAGSGAGPANITIDNRTFGGATTVNFSGSGAGVPTFRNATFLFSGNANFAGGFRADNLLAGATNGGLNFGGPVLITGASPFAPVLPDIQLFNLMRNRGLRPPAHGPNVQLLGTTGINITNPFVLGGPDPFIKLFSGNAINAPGLTSLGGNTLAVVNPVRLASPILFRDVLTSPVPGALNLFNVGFQGLPDSGGTTLVFGELGPAGPNLSGDITIGPDAIDLGSRNLFIISRGRVSGDELISTTGIFEIIGLAATNVFEVPIVDEFDDDQNDDDDDEDDVVVNDGDNGDDSESDISEESDSSSMECQA